MNIAIIGLGTRGTQLTQLAAANGHTVAIFDSDSAALSRAQLRIQQDIDRGVSLNKLTLETSTRLKQAILPARSLEHCADADLIMECIPDQLEEKKALLEKLDRLAPRTTLIISTGSALSISVLAIAAKRFPERLLGITFFPPILTNPLAQIITGDQSAKDMLDRAEFFARQLNKTSIVLKDVPGLLVERLTITYTGEALRITGEGHITPEAVDKLIGALGVGEVPFRLMDQQGIDQVLSQSQRLYEATFQDPRYRPHTLLRKMVELNTLGRKTKQGFYKYNE